MVLPVFPVTFTWGTAYDYNARLNKTRYGEGGISQRDDVMINPITEAIDVTINLPKYVVAGIIGYADQKATLEAFLRERHGRPFKLQAENNHFGTDYMYSCAEWSFQALGNGVVQFKGKLQQVRILNSG